MCEEDLIEALELLGLRVESDAPAVDGEELTDFERRACKARGEDVELATRVKAAFWRSISNGADE